MSRKNKVPLADRIAKAAEAALAVRDFVSAIDVLIGIGWLDPQAVESWRRGQVDCLERVIRSNLPRISEAMKLFRSWATGRGLTASATAYVARTPRRQTLRFSRSGNASIEASYRTHWVSPKLSEKKRERLAQKANRAPELVVIQPLNDDWTCHRCGRWDAWPLRRPHRGNAGRRRLPSGEFSGRTSNVAAALISFSCAPRVPPWLGATGRLISPLAARL